MTLSKNQKAVFLDRDGVINFDRGYVSQWSDFELLPGVVTALADLQDLGYRLIVVTNQSGIGRGFYTRQLNTIHRCNRNQLLTRQHFSSR